MSSQPAAAKTSRRLTYAEAVIGAMAEAMRADESVFYIGQDVGPFGGAMQGTKGLFGEFGAERVMETPISESAMVGVGVGAAMLGRRPIVEVSFGEFLPAAMNQLINQAPNIYYMTGGGADVPLVVRTRVGDGPYGGHPQDYSAWFAHVPGFKVVMPATPADAWGLMRAAIAERNPVIFFEPMSLSHGRREAVDTQQTPVAIGAGRVARAGSDATIVAWGSSVPLALAAADELQASGVAVEVVDLRSLRPWDQELVRRSVSKTGRLLTLQESWVSCGFGAEVITAMLEGWSQPAPLRCARVGTKAVPVPSGPVRQAALPQVADAVAAVRELL